MHCTVLQRHFLGSCVCLSVLACSMAHGALIAHYKFDEPTGSTTAVNEVTANGGDGLIGANVVTGVAGKVGNAVSLNDAAGQADIIDMGNATGVLGKITASGQLTLSYWLSSTDTSGGRNVAVFLGDDTDSNAYIDSGIVGGATEPNAGKAQGRNRDNTNTGADIGELFGVLVNDGTFHHIALTIDTLAATGALYVDGVLATSGSGAGFDSFPILNNLEVGRLGRSAPTDAFAGLVDDLQIYDTALSAAGITLLNANPGAVIPEPSACVLLTGVIGVMFLGRRGQNF